MYDVIKEEEMHPKTTEKEVKTDEPKAPESDVSRKDKVNDDGNKKVNYKTL